MTVFALPRMSSMAVDIILSESMDNRRDPELIGRIRDLPHTVTYATVGATRCSEEQLAGIWREANAIAKVSGYPDRTSQSRLADFDKVAAVWLTQHELLQGGEALRNDVWAFISTWLLPQITFWRFGDTKQRYHGGVRNTFQRLWLRGKALDRGVGRTDRWGLVERLTEDAFTDIIERPSISGRPVLARALAEGWVRASERFGRGPMKTIMREATIGVRLQNEVVDLLAISAEDLAQLIDDEFIRAERKCFNAG